MGFFEDIKQQSLASWASHKILPSVVVAQFILESGWRPGGSLSGLSSAPYHNLFGIKASPDWKGRKVNMPTREVGPQGSYWINADFRAYDSWADSIKDHAAFFTNTEWRKNNYRFVVGEKDYKVACRALQASGYATDPSYGSKLIGLIESYKLYELDRQVLSATAGTAEVEVPKIEAKTTNKTTGGVLGQAARDEAKKLDVTVIGDELGVGTLPYLQNRFKSMNSDCAQGRTLAQGAAVLQELKRNNRLSRYVVVILGTNGEPSRQHLDSLIAAVGGEHRLLLVDTASEVAHRQELTNLYYDASVRHQNVYFVNWGAYSFPRTTQFYSERTMTGEGYSRHAEYIVQAVYEASSGSFTGRILQQTSKQYHGIESIEYNHEGLYSPKGQSIIYNAEANDRWGFRVGAGGSPLWIDGFFELSNENRPGMLMHFALEYMKKHSVPEVQYTVPLAIMPDSLSIGDRGVFIDHEFNPPLAIEATVLEITTSDTDPASNSVVIGNVIELFSNENDDITQMKRELAQMREERKQEYRKGEPVKFTCESSAGLILQEESKTQLVVTGKQGEFEVPSLHMRYQWERDSGEDDTAYNQMLANTQNGPVLDVYAKDVVSDETTFYCRVYGEDGQLLGVTGAVLSIAKRGKSAYEIWLDAGNLGTEQEFLQKLKGDPGQDGIPGAKGADGRTSYMHIAWANGTQGEDFSTSVSLNKRYIGTYTDFTQADSTDPTRYKWALIQGPQGPQGQRGLDGQQGPKGDQGIPGAKGADGRTSYTHIAYANSSDGRNSFSLSDSSRTYIGMYVDFVQTDSTDPARYKWTRAKGQDGAQGVPGAKGADGRTPYLHIAYATSADGRQGFSVTDSSGKRYIGTYTDFTQADSTDPTRYKWTPLFDNVSVGGTNLLLGSNIPVTTTGYGVNQYTLAEKPVVGETYTISFKGFIPPGRRFGFYNSGGSVSLGVFPAEKLDENGIGSLTIVWKNTVTTSVKTYTGADRSLDIYNLYGHLNVPEARIEWIKMERGNIRTDYSQHPSEIQKQIDSKASQRETDEYLNHIRGEIQKTRQEQEALASMQAVNEVVKQLHLLREAYERDGQASAEKLTEALTKLAKIENDLGDFAVRFNFINLMMQFSDEGFVIGNKTRGTYMLFTDEEISIFNNGERVAFIKGGTLQFVQGIFIERVQIGPGLLGSYESDPDIVVLRWIGRGNA